MSSAKTRLFLSRISPLLANKTDFLKDALLENSFPAEKSLFWKKISLIGKAERIINIIIQRKSSLYLFAFVLNKLIYLFSHKRGNI